MKYLKMEELLWNYIQRGVKLSNVRIIYKGKELGYANEIADILDDVYHNEGYSWRRIYCKDVIFKDVHLGNDFTVFDDKIVFN